MSNAPETPLAAWSRIPFASQDEVIAAMRDPRYSSVYGDAYRAAVEAKLLLSEGFLENNVGRDSTTRAFIGTESLHQTPETETDVSIEQLGGVLRVRPEPKVEAEDKTPEPDNAQVTMVGGVARVTIPKH